MTSKTRILIVDDDARNIRILYEILSDDFDLFSADSGEDALDVVGNIVPDIMLLDIMMPGIDGYEVCEKLKTSDKYKNIKIILVSGKALTEERIKGYESGADDFVSKPFDIDEIHAKVTVFAKLKSMEEVNKLKTDFLSLINHEMGTPLNHIISISDLLLNNSEMNASISSSVSDIGTAAHLLSNKISRILYLSSLQQSSVNRYMEINIRNIFDDVLQMVDQSGNKKYVDFEIVGENNIYGDFDLIQKAFIYLVEIAVHYSRDSVISISSSSALESGVDGVEIEISDSRDELSVLQIEHYFDPFYVEDLLLHNEGLNVSMAICEKIIAMHNGKISIQNGVVSGTTLSIWLPAAP